MNENELPDASLQFAKSLNGAVWELLQKPDRTEADDELMVHAAHASCYHWLVSGTGLHHQRAEWLVSHVYAELGLAEPALRHAARCLELTGEYADLMYGFDRAYAYEAMARAHALAGNRDDALHYIQLAEQSANAIAGAEDRRIFLGDLESGDWHGLR